MQDTSTQARIHLPIEGHTKWPFVIRAMAFGSTVTVLVLGIVYFLLLAPYESEINPVLLIVGVVALLMMELFVIRHIVVPMNGDYGRFRITNDRVDFFPLSRYGFSTLTDPVAEAITVFTGVRLCVADGNSRDMNYDVILQHPSRTRTIRVRSFPGRDHAESFARELARTLGLKFIPLE